MRHPLSVEKAAATEAFMAKLTFCGMSPVAEAIASAFNFATTMPARTVRVDREPLFPGWTGAEICRNRLSFPSPASAVTLPVATLPPDESTPDMESINDDVFALPYLKTPVRRLGLVQIGCQQGEVVFVIPCHDFGTMTLPFRIDTDLPAPLNHMGVGQRLASFETKNAVPENSSGSFFLNAARAGAV